MSGPGGVANRVSIRCALAVAAIGWLSLLAFVGYQQSFSSFAGYDDEGYVLLSLRQFMAGKPLYLEVFSQYGPAYYFVNELWHSATSMPVTTDMARFKTLGLWLLATALAGLTVLRLTQRPWFSVTSLPIVFFHFDRLGLEPAHPQDFCLLLLAGSLLLATFVDLRQPRLLIAIGLGVLSGLLVTTKVNLGGFLGIGLVMATLLASRRSLGRNLLLLTLAGLFVVAAWSMVWPFITWTTAWQIPTAVTVGLSGLLLIGWQGRDISTPWKWLLTYGAVSAGSASLFVLLTLATGTSWESLRFGMYDQHVAFMKSCFVQPPVSEWHVLVGALSLPLAVVVRRSPAVVRTVLFGAPILLSAIVAAQFGESLIPIRHGMQPRSGADLLISFLVPCAWLAIVASDSPGVDFRRTTLAVAAVLQIQSAIPVPGTQMALGTYAAIVLLFAVVADFVGHARTVFPRFRLEYSLILVIALVTLSTTMIRGEYHRRVRFINVPLALSGTTRLRLPADTVAKMQAAVAAVRSHSSTFVTLPTGLNSLYLWSDIEPPTGFNTTLWDRLLTESQQTRVIKELQRAPRPRLLWLVTEPFPLQPGLLVDHLVSNYTVCEQSGSFVLLAPTTLSHHYEQIQVDQVHETSETNQIHAARQESHFVDFSEGARHKNQSRGETGEVGREAGVPEKRSVGGTFQTDEEAREEGRTDAGPSARDAR